MDLDQAIYDHAEWKIRFQAAIGKHEPMDVASIWSDDCCNLGRWLCGEGKRIAGHLTTFTFLVQTHAAFHQEAARIAALIHAGDFPAAEAELEYGTPYARASQGVALAIMSLQEAMQTDSAQTDSA